MIRVEVMNVDDIAEVLSRLAAWLTGARGAVDVGSLAEPKRPTPTAWDEAPTEPNDMPTIRVWTPDDSAE